MKSGLVKNTPTSLNYDPTQFHLRKSEINPRHASTGSLNDPLEGFTGSTKKLQVDDWYKVEMSSRKSTKQRRIDEMLEHLTKGDTLVVAELSRLARSVGQIAVIVDTLCKNGVRVICIKEGINVNGKKDMQTKVMITMFSLFAEIERDLITLKEKKTGKHRRSTLNKAAAGAIQGLLRSRDRNNGQPLFVGQRGRLTVPSVNRLVKQWCRSINLKGNYGSHSLRKTFGYHQRVSFGVSVPELMVVFNHSSQRETLEYLCIQPEEVRSIYMNEL